MDINLLPDLERRAVIEEQYNKEPTYSVIEFKGYYARINIYAELGQLFYIQPTIQKEDTFKVAGVVSRSSRTEQISLLLLYEPLNAAHGPFFATKLETEFFKADLI